MERLESRQLLAVASVVESGVLKVSGDADGAVEILAKSTNGTNALSIAGSIEKSLVVKTGNGNDSVTIESGGIVAFRSAKVR